MEGPGQLRSLDNCEIFSQFRSSLRIYDQNVKSLKSFIYWSGNEEAIKELSDMCVDILLEQKLILIKENSDGSKPDPTIVLNADEPEAKDRLRGLLVYLILNSANDYKYEVEQLAQWNPQCAHLLRQLPHALPQFLTLALVFKCGLMDFFAEFLSCGPIWLTEQYYGCLNETLCHLTKDKFKSLDLLCLALKSASQAIGWQNEEMTLLPSQVAKLLQLHLLDSEERLRMLRPARRKLYLGQAITKIMEILIDTLDIKKNEEKQLPPFFHLYQLRQKKKINITGSTEKFSSATSYALVLLHSLQNLVQVVSVDTFIHWMELPSQKPLYNLQERICFLSSDLVEFLAKDDNLKLHSICKQLDSFAQAAKTFEQRLEELPLGKLLSFLDGEEGEATEDQFSAGLHQLFQHSIAFGNDECVETMTRHIQLMKLSHAQKIIEHLGEVALAKMMLNGQGVTDEGITIKQELDDENEDEQQEYSSLISQVLYPIYLQCTSAEQIQILNQRDDLQLLRHFRFDIVDQEDQRVLFFNQFSINSQRLPLGEFLQLCFAKPLESWLSLAQLSMKNEGFALIFWRLACLCSGNIFHYMVQICNTLFRDERMLHNQNSQNFMLSLYIYPLILNGLTKSMRLRKNRRCLRLQLNLKEVNYAYTLDKLKSAQFDYLEAFASSLNHFSESNTTNYAIICKLMSILIAISRLDEHLELTSHKEISLLRAKKVSDDDLNTAKEYTNMHVQLAQWRRSNWILIAQLIQTMDLLRWNLTCYNSIRVDALNLVVVYWKQNTPHAYLMPPGLCNKIHAMVGAMKNKPFWFANDLLQCQDIDIKETVAFLTQASVSEAKMLMRNALICGKDKPIMTALSLAVDTCGSENFESAMNGYTFLFKCYIKAFQSCIPHKIKSGVCLRWVENLLEVVFKSPEATRDNILKLAATTLITIYRKSSDEDGKEMILQYLRLMPQSASTEIIINNIKNIRNVHVF